MRISILINDIKDLLKQTFASIDSWFEKDVQLCNYLPQDGGWSIIQILEHIALTNHYLLILIEKGTNKALQNARKLDLENELSQYSFQAEKLNEIGINKSFPWIRPDHMEPSGNRAPETIRIQLREQMEQCISNLNRLKNGEGVLYKTTMSVNNLGKINVYEYIYFLAKHGERHIRQMERVASEFEQNNT